MKTIGSKLEVFNGSAKHTSGGLTKGDLMKNKTGKVVSKKKHALGMTVGKRNLGVFLAPAKVTRKGTRVVKGKGIGSDIGSVVDSVGSLFGLGLPPKRRKPVRGEGLGTTIGSLADSVGSLFGLGLKKKGGRRIRLGGEVYSSEGGRA